MIEYEVMSSEDPQKDPLLSSKDAGKLLGYTHDYISKLCREGKMNGVQKGRIWYVQESEVHAFRVRHQQELDAKKAHLSQKFSEIRSKHETQRQALKSSKPSQSFSIPRTPKITQMFSTIPREVIAVSVLLLAILAPSVINMFSATDAPNLSVQKEPPTLVDHVDEGVRTVLEAHTQVINRTANAYSFVPYLGDGYWQLALSSVELGKGSYAFLKSLSDGYLALYMFQGHAIYQSMVQTHQMGTVVLFGYELIGEAMYEGTKNTVHFYGELLQIEDSVEVSKKKLNNFASDTSGGFQFARAEVKKTLWGEIKNSVMNARATVVENLASNFFYVASTFQYSISYLTATVHDAFIFSFEKDDNSILKTELK